MRLAICYIVCMKYGIALVIFLLSVAPAAHAGPIVRFSQTQYDFGEVSKADTVSHAFEISNAGDEDLVIEKIKASSGHASAVANPPRLKPGEKGKIEMDVDLRGMRGIYSKTIDVYTNDMATPVTTLSVKIALPDQIPMSDFNANEIFAGKCRTCHVDQGRGKLGWELFSADCFMCHNAGKNTSLTAMSRRPAAEVEQAIREGLPGTLMPAFSAKNGGPLDEVEIKSLMELIISP